MATPTFLEVQKRFNGLIGEDATTNSTAVGKDHINAAILDIINTYNFSWNVKSGTVTLTSGTGDLPSDYNPRWHVLDARIVNSSTGDDSIFKEVPISDRDAYTTDSYVYWITYDTSNDVYVFNTPTQTGSVTVFYNFTPATLSADADVVVVPDKEAVAYLAAAKNWVGDERNVGLKNDFEQESAGRVQNMYVQDQNFGPVFTVGNPVDYNPNLYQGGISTDFIIERP